MLYEVMTWGQDLQKFAPVQDAQDSFVTKSMGLRKRYWLTPYLCFLGRLSVILCWII